jgi:8-oxo-dGTP diphosphatase
MTPIDMSKENDLKRGTDYIGVNVVFWCQDNKGRVLMHKRSKNCRDEQGTWDCGAGSMEFGETFEEAVRREVKEEYGTDAIDIRYMTTLNVLRRHEERTTHWVKNMHWVLLDPGQVVVGEPDKIDEIGWFELDKLPTPLHSQIDIEVQMLKDFLAKNKIA